MTFDHLWIDPSFGASGDMILGALIALGADTESISEQLAQLGVDGLGVMAESDQRCGLNCTRATVSAPAADAEHRTWSSIDGMIASSELPAAVQAGARATFRRLAEVEANIHATAIDNVHFHEVGAHDSIADIVGAWIGWHLLGSPSVSVGRFGLGYGTVLAAHGQLPLPAPAVADLLINWPTCSVEIEMETVTPTGAALLTTMASDQHSAPPAGTIVAVGRGGGGRDPQSHPNVVTAVACRTENRPEFETMVELTTNVDDVTAEVLAFTIERCLEQGAADAWSTPIAMKKGRSGQMLTVLCSLAEADGLRELVLGETGSLGIRQRTVERYAANRQFHTVDVLGQPIRIKEGPGGAKPEFDDCAAAARELKLPLRTIQAKALEAFAP